MFEDILGLQNKIIEIEAFVDNKSVIEAILSTRLVEDKRLRIDISAIKESLQQNKMGPRTLTVGELYDETRSIMIWLTESVAVWPNAT